MIQLGNTFHHFYVDNTLNPLRVLEETFSAIENSVDKQLPSGENLYKCRTHLQTSNGDILLKYKGVHTNNLGLTTGIKFKVVDKNQTLKRVILQPSIDRYEDGQKSRYQMTISFPKDRKDELSASGYLQKIVRDVFATGATNPCTIDKPEDAISYTFGTISFRRCI